MFINTKRISQLKAGAFLSYAVLCLNTLVGLLYTPYMLRMMGKSEYGLFSLVASVIAYLTILDLGFGNAIIRYTAKFRVENKTKEQSEMFGMFLILYSFIAVIAVLIGFVLWININTLFGKTMTYSEIIRTRVMLLLMIFNLAITFPFSIFQSIIIAYENFIFQKMVVIIRIFLNTGVMIILLHWGYRAVAMVLVLTIFNMITLLINYFYCKSRLNIKIVFGHFQWCFLKEITSYSCYIFLNAIMDRIYWSTGQFVLGAVSGTTSVAVYAVAIQLQQMYMQFSTAISGVFLPKVTTMVAKNKTGQEISELFIRTGRIQFCVMSFILSGFILFGKQFIGLWAGNGYSDAYIIALLFFIPLIVPLIQNLGITILQARNQLKFRSVLYVIIAICSLGLQIPLAKHYGGIGCAVAIATALTIGQVLVMNIYYHRNQGLNILSFWKEIGKMSVVPVGVSVIAFFVLKNFSLDTPFSLFLGMLFFTLLYVPLFWRFSMNKHEEDLITSPLKNIRRNFI
nr:oligosaccharide flippase family protein [uncultured Desulfobacter sp.]